MRLEDTDQQRHQEQAISSILSQLQWLGLHWDEGLSLKGEDQGDFGPYRQSERIAIYKEKALELIEKGKAFYCFMSPEREEREKKQAIKEGRPWRALSEDRSLSLSEAKKRLEKGEPACIRFKTPQRDKNYEIHDLLRGALSFPPDALGDFVLIRRDGFPVYNFSCAIDDSSMAISHVLRGEEHLSNSLKQKLIQEALGWTPPKTAHLSLILGPDKKKLSKRSGAESVAHYKQEGFLPQALANFLALMGWNPGTERELFSLKELIQHFDLKRLNISPAVFDKEKLLWLNGQHIKQMGEKELFSKIKSFSGKELKDKAQLIPHLRSGFKTLKQAELALQLFDDEGFGLNPSAKEVLQKDSSLSLLQKGLDFLSGLPGDKVSLEDFKAFQKRIQKEEGLKGKDFFIPIRSALIGQTEGLEIKILILLMPKAQILQRLKQAISKRGE